MDDGFAVVRLEDAAWSPVAEGVSHAPLTAALCATETTVDAYRLADGRAVDLSVEVEQLLVPIDAGYPIPVTGSTSVPPHGLGRVPAGVEAQLQSRASATVLVVAAPAAPAPDATPVALDPDDWPFVIPATSAVATAFLTAPLGCAAMKVNVRRLEPGQAVPYHTEGDQEELFVPVCGPGEMTIDGEASPTPPGTVARVAPDVPRSAVNDGTEDAHWVMVGAPPTGGPTDWDPGAEILD